MNTLKRSGLRLINSWIHVVKSVIWGKQNPEDAKKFVIEQLSPNVDARVFEIVSYAILKERYGQKSVWIGPLREEVEEEFLVLYKTGRTKCQ